MRTDDLTWFLHLSASGHVSATADELGISQPALSRAIMRLETEVGAPLFDRVKNRLVLNSSGEVFYAHAQRSTSELALAVERIRALSAPRGGLVALHYVTSFGTQLVPRLIAAHRASGGQARFSLRGGAADSVLQALRTGAAEVAITAPRPASDEFTWLPLMTERLALAVASNSDLAQAQTVQVQELDALQLVMLRPEFGLRQITDAFLREHHVRVTPSIEATEISTLWGLVSMGLGVSIMPSEHPPQGVTMVPLSTATTGPEPTRTAGLVLHATRPLSPAASEFVSHVRALPAA